MKERLRSFRHHLLFLLRLLTGQASTTVDFQALAHNPDFMSLHEDFFRWLGGYEPHLFEPLHTYYEQRGQTLPPRETLRRSVAQLAAEFVMIMRWMKEHRLPPETLMPLVEVLGIEHQHELTERCLQAARNGEAWALTYFYGVSVYVMKLHEAHAMEVEPDFVPDTMPLQPAPILEAI